MTQPMRAGFRIGDSVLMLASEFPPSTHPPNGRSGTGGLLHLYVVDVDAAFERAVKVGGIIRMPVSDMFWGPALQRSSG